MKQEMILCHWQWYQLDSPLIQSGIWPVE